MKNPTREELTSKEAIRAAWLAYNNDPHTPHIAYGDWFRCYMMDVETCLKLAAK